MTSLFPIIATANIIMALVWAYELAGVPLVALVFNCLGALFIFIAWVNR